MKTVKTFAVLAVLLYTFTAAAAEKSWRIAEFHDNIAIEKDGSAVVRERIVLVFVGAWHGIHRTIPIEYPGPDGTNYELFVDVQSVTDGSGSKLKYESSRTRGDRDLKIYIPGAVDSTKIVEITYLVRNGTRFFKDYDEFYWNVTGNDWPVPIDHATATVRFPEAAAGSLRAQAFTGVYGSTQRDATANVAGSAAQFETNNPLPMRGGLTVDVYIPKDILKEPSPLTKFFWFLAANPSVFLPLVTFGGMFVLWWYKGRDPDAGMSVAPMYEPPPGISPAEAGTLIDDSIHPRDITCTMVDLAVRGYIKIEETAEKVLLFTHKDYIFHLLKPREEWGTDLAPHERVMLENIFAGGAETRLSSLKNRFYTAVPDHSRRHHVVAEEQRCLSARSGIRQWLQHCGWNWHLDSVRHFSVHGMGKLLQFHSLADCLRPYFGSDLVAVRAGDECQDSQRRADAHCGAGLPGIHEPGGCGAAQTACRRPRSRSICPMPWRWEWSITGRRPLRGL